MLRIIVTAKGHTNSLDLDFSSAVLKGGFRSDLFENGSCKSHNTCVEEVLQQGNGEVGKRRHCGLQTWF